MNVPPNIAELIPYLTEPEQLKLAEVLDLKDRKYWLEDPVGYAYFMLHVKILTSKQKELLRSVKDNEITIARSANAVGKGFSAAIAALWFYNNPIETKVILVAPPSSNQRQLRLIWGEIESHLYYRKKGKVHIHRHLANAGTVTSLAIQKSNRHFIRAYTVPITGTIDQRKAKFSGEHAERLMYIIDEADGVLSAFPEVWGAIQSCISGGNAKVLMLFNPRAQVGPVWELERTGKANLIELDAFDHPNVALGPIGYTDKGEPIEHIPGAVTRKVTVERIVDWSIPANETELEKIKDNLQRGEPGGAQFFQIPKFLNGSTSNSNKELLIGDQWRKVENPALFHMTLARYGLQSARQLIPLEAVEAAQTRWRQYTKILQGKVPNSRPLMGLDIADEGADNNSVCFRYEGYVLPFITWNGVDPNVSAKHGGDYAIKRNARQVNIDGIGVGAGVPARLKEYIAPQIEDTIRVEKVIVSESARTRPEVDGIVIGNFRSLRDELHWLAMLWLKNNPSAMLPPGSRIVEQATACTYETIGNTIVVSPKKKVRRLIGYSPDEWDSLLLTFYLYRSFVMR